MNTTEKAAYMAKAWCDKHKGWIAICDIDTTVCDYNYKWEELSERKKSYWTKRYGDSAEEAWDEFAVDKEKYASGFINSEGIFYPHIYQVPTGSGLMQVFHIGKDLSKAITAGAES